MKGRLLKISVYLALFAFLLSPVLGSLDDFSNDADWEHELNGSAGLSEPAELLEIFSNGEAALEFTREERLASSGLYVHLVLATETLETIGRLYRVDLDELCQINGIHGNAKIPAGFKLMIP